MGLQPRSIVLKVRNLFLCSRHEGMKEDADKNPKEFIARYCIPYSCMEKLNEMNSIHNKLESLST